MKNIKLVFALSVLLSVFSCEEPLEHQFIYGFENAEEATAENINKVLKVIDDRLLHSGLKFIVETYQNEGIKIKVYSNTLIKDAFDLLVTNKGKFEFWETCEAQKLLPFIKDLEKSIIEKAKANKEIETSFLKSVDGAGYPGSPILFFVKQTDTLGFLKTLNSYRHKLPEGYKYVKFLYGLPREDDDAISVYTLKSNKDNTPEMTGEVIAKANQGFGSNGNSVISVSLNDEGALQWEHLTGRAYNNKSQIAMVLNDIVFTAPGLNNGAIKGGRFEISGNLSLEEAKGFAAIIASNENIPQLKLLKHTKQSQ